MPVSRRSRTGPSCRVLPGDCLDVLPGLPEDHFDSVVTDPPYDLTAGKKGGSGRSSLNLNHPAGRSRITTGGGFMGKEWDATGVAFDPATWQAVLRVTKPGGHLLACGGTRTWHRLACAIEDAGFEIRDSIDWIYGSGFPKSKASLKPAHEPIILARRPSRRSEPLPGLDACRVGVGGYDAPGDRGHEQNRNRDMAFRMTAGKSNDAGRWPPNVLLTHSQDCQPAGSRKVRNRSGSIRGNEPSAVTDAVYAGRERVPWKAHGDADGMETVQAWDCAPGCPVAELDRQRGKMSTGYLYSDTGGASRFFPAFRYQAKAPKSERPRLEDGTAWPTVKPLELMRWLARLVTEPGGLVLDPFAGTGTTGQACLAEGFSSVLIERDPVARELIRVRIPEHQ